MQTIDKSMTTRWQCKWSPTLGALESGHKEIWGTDDYTDEQRPTVFFGIYGLPDFYALWRHKGEKHVLWAGSDIRHLINKYWLDETGLIRIASGGISTWINRYCTNWVENEVEEEALAKLGITAKVCPSFLGDINQFKLSFKPGNKLYTSVSGDNFVLYGWGRLHQLARENQDLEFHLYGNTKPFKHTEDNIFVHGRVPKEQMNQEISEMQGALRLTEFDGFSEILAKSVLMGQYPVSYIRYEAMLDLESIALISELTKPNIEGRKHYLKILNNYPWNSNKK